MNIKSIIILIIYIVCIDASKLNLPRILLPLFKSFSTNYTLEVTGFGCYKWSSSRLDVVQVTPIEENPTKQCSQKAIVSSVAKVSTRTMAIVLAEEVLTGQIFRADVIVDVISSLNVVTTTRELYMEEPPEMFEVRAYDAEGNEFTTLEGVELLWTVMSERSGQEVLRFISFRESTYETPQSIASFDVVGKQGHIVLLEGIRTGTSQVSVKLSHPEYSLVPSVDVTISVIANLIIDPSDVYILQGDKINFRILQVRQGRLIEIKMTSTPQYILVPEDRTIVQVENQVATGLNLGRSKLLLQDLNSNSVSGEQQKLPQAFITVVLPSYISLSIEPHNNWALFIDEPATLITEVFDSDNRKITLGQSAHVDMSLNESIFPISRRSVNGSYAEGESVVAGITEVKSQLYEAGSSSASGSRPLLKTCATLHVFPPLSLYPPIVAFPFHHIAWNELEMRVEGGDGINLWRTHNHSVAVVNQAGVLKPIGEGETKVEVAMVRNEHLKATSSVLVLKPHAMEILSGVYETPVGSHIHLDIALYGLTKHGVRVPFTDCSQMTFSVNVDASFEYDRNFKKEASGDACTVISLLAKQDTKSQVSISLIDGLIECQAMIAAFRPLSTMHPVYGKSVVLAVKSSRHIVFSGGPKPWFGKVFSAHSSNPSILQASVYHESQELYVYNIVCNKIGTTEFTLTASTEPYVANISPVKSQATVTVICAKPKHLELSANMGPDCPTSDLDRALAAKNSKFKVKIVVRDAEGRKFDNATSLMYRWFWGKENLFVAEEPGTIDLDKQVFTDYVLPMDHFKELTTKNTAESSKIKLKAIGYLHDKLSTDIKAEGSMTVNIVNGLTTEPTSLSVINQVGTQSVIKLNHGSGYFAIETTPDHIVSCDSSNPKFIRVQPLRDGRTTLQIVDRCIASSSVNLPIQVLNVGMIKIEVTSRMEVGRQTTATVKLYDTLDRELSGDIDNIVLESTSSGIVKFTRSDPNNPRVFLITAMDVGRTSLIATFNNISSPPALIQVFTAIKLYPRNITLLVGAEFQVRVTGGPGPDLQFTMSDSSVATISSTGLINALHIGESWVSVSTLGGEGRDSIAVLVVPLTGVHVGGPTTVLCVGGRAPLWPSPIPEAVSPLVLGSVNPPFSYSWTSSLPGVAHLTDRYAPANIHVKEEDRLSVEVRGAKPGRTVIQLRLTGGSSHHSVYESSLELLVVDELEFTLPPTALPSIIVAPQTKFHIRTNLENAKLRVLSMSSEDAQPDEEAALSMPVSVLSLNRDQTATANSLGQALVLASSHHPRPIVQSTAVLVQVKPVHYMIINIANVVNGSGLSALPRGLDLLLNITYHDSLGRTFYAALSKVSLKSNRHDKILKKQGLTNSSFTIGLEGRGVTVLHASDPISPVSQDFLKLPVENHILPLRRQLTVGEVVCFESAVRRGGSIHGSWSCEGDSVVIEQGGLARAVKPGTAVLTYKESSPQSNIQTSINIDVNPLHSLSFGGAMSLSNAEVGKDYVIPVHLLSHSTSRTTRDSTHSHSGGPCSSNYPVQIFPFSCQMRFNSLSVPHPIGAIFTVKPTFDRSSGGFGCLVRVVGGASSNTSVILSNVTLRISSSLDFIQDSSFSQDAVHVTQDSVVLEFHPAVYVVTPQLNLPSPSSVAHLVIVATPQVAQHVIIEAGDRTMVKIGSVEKRGSVSWVWPVLLYREHWSNLERLNDLSVILISPLTNQTIKVPVVTPGSGNLKGCVYADYGGWKTSDLFPSTTTSIFVAIIAIIVFFMASNYCYLQWNRMQPISSPQRFSPSHPSYATLQEYSLGQSTPSPHSHRSVVYGSHDYNSDSPNVMKSGSGSARMRRLYQ